MIVEEFENICAELRDSFLSDVQCVPHKVYSTKLQDVIVWVIIIVVIII
jgi:hypothetical protein